MNLGQLRAELQARGFDGFQSDDLDRYINWGIFAVARKLRITGDELVVPFDLIAGAYLYDLSTQAPGIKSVRSVAITSVGFETPLEPMTSQRFWDQWAGFGFATESSTIPIAQVGEPAWYYVLDGNLIIMPALQAARDFIIRSWQAVQELTDDGAVYALPQECEELILLSSMRVCHTRANELDRANILKLEMEEQMRDLMTQDAFEMDELQERVEPDDWPN